MISRSGNVYPLLGDIAPRIEDLAWSLSMMCRYTGSVQEFYSIAEHSVHCSEIVPSHLAFQALMHDAHEAITQDVSAPVKEALRVYGNAYDKFERSIAEKVRRWYGLPLGLSPLVHAADKEMLRREMRDVWTPEAQAAGRKIGCDIAKSGESPRIFPMTQRQAYKAFMEKYERVGNGLR